MEEFLQSTPTVDSDSATIQRLAGELALNLTRDEDIARRSFLWVRDRIRHTSDHRLSQVTCSASEALLHGSGFCYAKSHLLAAILRARRIPAALCYQRLATDAEGSRFCLHRLVAVHLENHGWYRVDPRGDKPGIETDFCPPIERLAFTPKIPGEMDVPGLFTDGLPCVVAALRGYESAEELEGNLPDYVPSQA